MSSCPNPAPVAYSGPLRGLEAMDPPMILFRFPLSRSFVNSKRPVLAFSEERCLLDLSGSQSLPSSRLCASLRSQGTFLFFFPRSDAPLLEHTNKLAAEPASYASFLSSSPPRSLSSFHSLGLFRLSHQRPLCHVSPFLQPFLFYGDNPLLLKNFLVF